MLRHVPENTPVDSSARAPGRSVTSVQELILTTNEETVAPDRSRKEKQLFTSGVEDQLFLANLSDWTFERL